MIWLVTRFVVVPVKAALGGAKVGYWTGRVVGYRRLAVLGTGVVIGLLVAPGPGAQLRARIRSKLDGPGGAARGPVSHPPSTPTPTVVVPEPVRAESALGTDPVPGVPPEVVSTAQETVEATLPAPVPVADVPVPAGPAPLADPVTAVAEEEGEALPAVPDADPATVDPTTVDPTTTDPTTTDPTTTDPTTADPTTA